MDIQLNTLIEMTMPEDDLVVSVEDSSRIQKQLMSWGLPILPRDWVWNWTVSSKQRDELHHNYVGTIPKRIASYMFEEQDIKLTSEMMAALGNLASPAKNRKGEKYYFQIVNKFDWRAGQFGDENSCYFVRSGVPLKVLEENNIYGVCFYNQKVHGREEGRGISRTIEELKKMYESGKMSYKDFNIQLQAYYGYGRVWLMQNKPEDDMLTLFNGYGFQGDSLITASRILSLYFALSYRLVIAYNQGRMTGIVYINPGTRYEMINGKKEKVNKPRATILGTTEQLYRYPQETTILELDIKDTSGYYSDTDDEG